MNLDLILMFGSLILLAVSGLLVFCFTESKGKNTPHARKHEQRVSHSSMHSSNESMTMDNKLV